METVVSAASVLIILGAPFGTTYGFIENTFVRLLLVLFVAYSIRLGNMPGLLALLAAFSLLIERNHELLTGFPNQKPHGPLSQGSSAHYDGYPREAAPLEGEEERIPFDTPHVPASGRTVVETHGETTAVKEYEKTNDLKDSIPRIPVGPLMASAPAFYKSKNLL